MVAESSELLDERGASSLWDRLRAATDMTGYRPRLREGIASTQFVSTQGEEYAVIQNPNAATYLRLPAPDFYIFQLMDGSRTVQDLVVAYMLQFHRFALQHVMDLVEDLRYGQFLTDSPSYTYPKLRALLRGRSLRGTLDRFLGFYLNREFPVRGVDRALDIAYRKVAWALFTAPGLILLALITLIGVPLLLWNLYTGHIALLGGVSVGRLLPVFYVSILAMAITHELGHAFAVKASGRAVRQSGLCIFYGFPGLYVNTQDIWMAPRGARIAASWAGPYAGFILAAIAGIALAIFPAGAWVPLVRAFGVVALVENAFQLMPFIQLDGYYMVMDWLDIPNLRRRALIFIRHDLWQKLWHRQGFNREERIFTVFGVLAFAYTIYAIFLGISFWWAHARDAIQNALRVPSLGSLLLLVLLLLILIPFALGIIGRALGLARTLALTVRRATGAARERWLRERATLLGQVPAISRLGREPLYALAAKVDERRAQPGTAIVRQGEAGDRFYLIVDGNADVSVEDDDGSNIVAELGPMDYFGERALLDSAPRAATVRATTRLRLLSLAAKDFRTSIQPNIAADAALHEHLADIAELDRFSLLEPLGAREKEVLRDRLKSSTKPAGATVVRQGEPGDEFYLIRSGSAEVFRTNEQGQDVLLQTLHTGDYFGEIALLYDSPRVATVRAKEPLRLWALSRRDFSEILRLYFNLDDRLSSTAEARLAEDRLVAAREPAPSNPPTVGDRAPDFTLESADGDAVSLSELRGGTVLLWFSAGRPEASSPLLAGITDSLENDVALLQIDTGSASAPAQPTINKTRLLIDPSGSTYSAYGMVASTEEGEPEGAGPWWVMLSHRLAASGRYEFTALRAGTVRIGPDGFIQDIRLSA